MRLFMSYHSRDYEAARRVVDALRERKPGLDIYFAPRVNLPGAYWVKRLAKEIEQSDFFAADPAAAEIVDLIVKAPEGVAPPQSEP